MKEVEACNLRLAGGREPATRTRESKRLQAAQDEQWVVGWWADGLGMIDGL